jgi:prevent-host-death family protein
MSWSVADAKAHLSEILRRARAGEPQLVGAQDPCVVISRKDFERMRRPDEHLGRWLIDAAARAGGEIETPPRRSDRAVAFPADDDGE